MNIIQDNFYWMLYNIVLAILPIIFGWIMYLTRSKLFKITAGFLWILFIPNSIYILTDMIHLPKDLMIIDKSLSLFVVIQYAVLFFVGVTTFILGMYPFNKLIAKVKKKSIRNNRRNILIFANLLIGFGIVLGRFQQTNSWEVFTNFQKVISNSMYVITSYKLLIVTFLFGALCNITYFALIRLLQIHSTRKFNR